MSLNYNIGTGNYENFIIGENCFNPYTLGKCETIMSQGNGYLGLRNTLEEDYMRQTRGFFLAGTYNKSCHKDVPELPNAPDVIGMELRFDNQVLDMREWTIEDYHRTLNMRTGLSQREVLLKNNQGKRIRLHFERFVSMDNLHLIAQKVTVTALDDVNFALSTGINGRTTNSGAQHFTDGEKRLIDNHIMRYVTSTTQSGIDVVLHSLVNIKNADSLIRIDYRKIWMEYSVELKKGEQLSFEKISTVHTSRDIDASKLSTEQIIDSSTSEIAKLAKIGFDTLLKQSANVWEEKVWRYGDVKIKSTSTYDQLALRFAVYHLYVMTPSHDDRMSIAAKGLSGEGYKGHVFWDCELFDLPFFLYTNPKVARSLLMYRFNSLPGARKKAISKGCAGAQYPWESAWIDDGEVTPEWGGADIITGKPIRVESGFIQIHVTSVVAFTVDRYYKATGDWKFMEEAGLQILLETALYWTSRLEYNDKLDRYELNGVMGPDEYKEHVDNNAFTNYMAHLNMSLALHYYELASKRSPEVLKLLEQSLDVDAIIYEVKACIDKVYLPQPNENGIIPQNDTYLSLREIDLTPFKYQSRLGTIYDFYNLTQINEIQVSKQTDVLLIFLLMEELFDNEIVRKNFEFYESRTLHDSTLSLSSHCILANRMGESALAYKLFEKAIRIDLGPNMKSSDPGIHAASIGGIWQCAIHGFGGVRAKGDTLHINPLLPKGWESLSFYYMWKGKRLHIEIEHDKVHITKEQDDNDKTFPMILVNGKEYTF